MYPQPAGATETDVAEGLVYASTMDAITRGTGDGLRLVANIGAMLIVLVSLVALVNGMLALPQMIEIELAKGQIINIAATTFWGPDGKPISAKDFIEKMYGQMPPVRR